MRTYMLLACMVVTATATSVRAKHVGYPIGVPGDSLLYSYDRIRIFTSAEITTPMRVSITPRFPTPSDEVVVTISGWTSSSESYEYRLDHVDLHIEFHDILLELYWVRVVRPVVRPFGEASAQSATEQVPLGQGPLQRNSYEVTESLGTFSPGTYKVYVTNHGPIEGGASASFTVRDSVFNVARGEGGLPSWWTPIWWIDPTPPGYVGPPFHVTHGL